MGHIINDNLVLIYEAIHKSVTHNLHWLTINVLHMLPDTHIPLMYVSKGTKYTAITNQV